MAPGKVTSADAGASLSEWSPSVETERVVAWRSTGVVLGLVVGLSFAVRMLAGLARPGPWILPDELLYSDLARSIASGDQPAVRGVTSLGWGIVYPTVISPAWVLFDDGMLAFHAITVVNALLMSLAAIPAYLLARLYTSRRASLLVATAAVLVPSLALTGSVMTESAAYPLFVAALWLVTRAVHQPTTATQAAALGAIVVLALTRTQGAVLFLALVIGACLYATTSDGGARRDYLRRLWPTWLVAGALAVLTVATAVGSGSLLGGRSSAVGEVSVGGLPRLLAFQTADLLLLLAVVPVLATVSLIVAGLSRRASAPMRLFASIALPTLVTVMLAVSLVTSSIDTEGAEGVNERYVFYLAPQLLVGLALWAEARPGRTPLDVIAVVVAAILVGILPFGELEADATFYAPALVPWVALPGSVATVGAVVFTLVFGLILVGRGARGTRLVAIATGSWLAVIALIAGVGFHHHATTAAAASSLDEPTWIDDAVPAGETVPALWDQRSATPGAPDADYYPLMLAATLNRSVTRTLRLGPATYYENVIPTVPVTAGPEGVVVDEAGGSIRARFVLVPCPLAVDGDAVARSDDRRLAVYRVPDARIRLVASRACPTG